MVWLREMGFHAQCLCPKPKQPRDGEAGGKGPLSAPVWATCWTEQGSCNQQPANSTQCPHHPPTKAGEKLGGFFHRVPFQEVPRAPGRWSTTLLWRLPQVGAWTQATPLALGHTKWFRSSVTRASAHVDLTGQWGSGQPMERVLEVAGIVCKHPRRGLGSAVRTHGRSAGWAAVRSILAKSQPEGICPLPSPGSAPGPSPGLPAKPYRNRSGCHSKAACASPLCGSLMSPTTGFSIPKQAGSGVGAPAGCPGLGPAWPPPPCSPRPQPPLLSSGAPRAPSAGRKEAVSPGASWNPKAWPRTPGG